MVKNIHFLINSSKHYIEYLLSARHCKEYYDTVLNNIYIQVGETVNKYIDYTK